MTTPTQPDRITELEAALRDARRFVESFRYLSAEAGEFDEAAERDAAQQFYLKMNCCPQDDRHSFVEGARWAHEQASLRWAARIQDEQKAKELLAKANDQCTEQLVAAQKEVVELKQKLAEAEHKAVNAVGADEKLHNENAKLRERVTQIENDAQIRHAQLLKCSDDVERLETRLALAVERLNYIVEKDLDDQPARACINDAFEFQDIARETLEKLK